MKIDFERKIEYTSLSPFFNTGKVSKVFVVDETDSLWVAGSDGGFVSYTYDPLSLIAMFVKDVSEATDKNFADRN